MFAWGFGANGSLGLGSLQDCFTPRKVAGLPPCCSIASLQVSVAVSNAGVTYVWGTCSTLAHPDAVDRARYEPLVHPSLAGLRVKSVTCSYQHATAVTEDGDIVAWGSPGVVPSMFLRRLQSPSSLDCGAPGEAQSPCQTVPYESPCSHDVMQALAGPQAEICGFIPTATGTMVLLEPSPFRPVAHDLRSGCLQLLSAYISGWAAQKSLGIPALPIDEVLHLAWEVGLVDGSLGVVAVCHPPLFSHDAAPVSLASELLRRSMTASAMHSVIARIEPVGNTAGDASGCGRECRRVRLVHTVKHVTNKECVSLRVPSYLADRSTRERTNGEATRTGEHGRPSALHAFVSFGGRSEWPTCRTRGGHRAGW